jgi:uncharacterized damage-inducible protein DinB
MHCFPKKGNSPDFAAPGKGGTLGALLAPDPPSADIAMFGQYLSLVAHMGWADQQVLGALRRSGTPADAWIELFGHILGAEQVWLARLEERAPSVAVWPALTIDECDLLAQQNQLGFVAFIGRLGSAGDQRKIPYRNSAGQDFESTVQDILFQVSLHGSYHRGQIALGMRQHGVAPAPTDYIGFVRGTPAATRQT